MVGLVVVSHSRALAQAAVVLAAEMLHGAAVPIEIAAGLDETTLGTDAVSIMDAIVSADRGDGVVVLMDLGSAVLSAELALEMLDDEVREKAVLCPAPLIEGLVAAVVAAAGGAGRQEVAAEAVSALRAKETQLGASPPPVAGKPDADPVSTGAGDRAADGPAGATAPSDAGAFPVAGVIAGALPDAGVVAGASPEAGVAAGALPDAGVVAGALPEAGVAAGALPVAGVAAGALPEAGVADGGAAGAGRVVAVTNQHGLHARPAARLVAEARRFDAEVEIRNRTAGSAWVPAGSLSRVTTLGVLRGHEIEVRASGPQAAEAVEGIVALAGRAFDEARGPASKPGPAQPPGLVSPARPSDLANRAQPSGLVSPSRPSDPASPAQPSDLAGPAQPPDPANEPVPARPVGPQTLSSDGLSTPSETSSLSAEAYETPTAVAPRGATVPPDISDLSVGSAGTLRGQAASEGIGIGPVWIQARIEPEIPDLPGADDTAGGADKEAEWGRVERGIAGARREIEQARAELAALPGAGAPEADIFAAHLLLLDDEELLSDVRARIDQGSPAPRAFGEAADRIANDFEALTDPYLKGRAADVRAVADQVVQAMADAPGSVLPALGVGAAVDGAGSASPGSGVGAVVDGAGSASSGSGVGAVVDGPGSASLGLGAGAVVDGLGSALPGPGVGAVVDAPGSVSAGQAPEKSIRVAEDLAPIDVVRLDLGSVAGVLLAQGSPTSHAAILARARGIPMVVGAGAGVLGIAPGTTVALDGGSGEFVVAPSGATLTNFRKRKRSVARRWESARARAHEPATTRDGVTIAVAANIGSADDARLAAENGADLAGLVRTEFLFLERDQAPDVEEQVDAYREIADALGGRRLTLRTLDVGGDKPLRYAPTPAERNPFLGVRGLRHSLAHPELFRDQLRAIVRIARETPISVMFPMVSNVDELIAARRILDEVAGGDMPKEMHVGIMVEVPAAALTATTFTPYVDFVSVGTNDLTQYALAAERGNPAVPVDGLDPAVLRLIGLVCRELGKPVAVCGELAADPAATQKLLALGVRELSVNPPAVPLVKEAVRAVGLSE